MNTRITHKCNKGNWYVYFPFLVIILFIFGCNKTDVTDVPKIDSTPYYLQYYKQYYASKYTHLMASSRIWHFSYRRYYSSSQDSVYFSIDSTLAIVVIDDSTIVSPFGGGYIGLQTADNNKLHFYSFSYYVGHHINNNRYAYFFPNKDSISIEEDKGESWPNTYSCSTP